MTEFKAAIVNDFQIPYHCPDAIDVAKQIIRAFKPEVLDLNGDILDLLNLSKFPGVRTAANEKVAITFQEEVDKGLEIIRDFVSYTKPDRVHWKNGNHEARLMRAVADAKSGSKGLLELKSIRDAYSVPALFRFHELAAPVIFAGEWPAGMWIHPSLPPEKNVWVEHGYQVASKTGYTASSVQEKRQSSVMVGHVHRLGLGWKHVNGGRDYFMIENGGLSILGTPQKGDGMYFGAPYSVADYMNSTQGFTLLTHTGGEWWPELIRIINGSAMWRGKKYTSRLK